MARKEIEGKRKINDNFEELYQNVVVIGEIDGAIDSGATNLTNKLTGDVIKIPSGALITNSYAVVKTAFDGTAIMTIGISDNTDLFIDSSGGVVSASFTAGVKNGLINDFVSAATTYTAAKTVVYESSAAIADSSAGTIDVVIKYINKGN